MRAREILSKNLRALMDNSREEGARLGAIRKVAEASGGKLTNGTVGRIAAGTHATDIDTLVDLAEVFGIKPWQLLVEDLNPKALPRLVDAALLSQIKQIVSVVQSPNEGISPSSTDELPLQKEGGKRRKAVGPALQEAFKGNGNAGGGSAKVAKHKGRGGR